MLDECIESIKRYVDHGVPTGDFLRAVLSNDLMSAMGRADIYNRACLFEIATYIYNTVPADAWGSREKYKAWIDRKANERETGNNLHEIQPQTEPEE
jgi:predicted nucleotidyltransferase